jgi:DNA helicase-4
MEGLEFDAKREGYVWSAHPELKLSFFTVHKAKGLEADYVVILNFRDGMLGFPNMIADDPLLEMLLSEREQIPFAEERRVFYVALTRARRRVFILVPDTGASVFLGDIPDDARPVACNDIQNAASCPKCKTGKLLLRKGSSEFYGCTNYPRCDYTLPIQKVPIDSKTMRCCCGGFLVPCHNPRNGQDFLGCTEYSHLRFTRHLQLPIFRN